MSVEKLFNFSISIYELINTFFKRILKFLYQLKNFHTLKVNPLKT